MFKSICLFFTCTFFASYALGLTQADLLAAQNNYQIIEKQYNQAKNAYDQAEIDLKDAESEVIQAQEKLAQAKNNHIKTKATYKISKQNLSRATDAINSVWKQINGTTSSHPGN